MLIIPIQQLGKKAELAEIEKLIDQLKHGQPHNKRTSLQELIDAREDATQFVLEAIQGASTEQIEEVFSAIDWEQNGDNQKYDKPFIAFRDLIEYDIWFIAAAIRYFEQMGTIAVKPLLGLLQSSTPEIRAWTAYTLGVIGDSTAVVTLLDRLDTDSDVERVRVITALGALKANQAVPKFIELLDHPHEYTQHVAAEALGAVGDPIAIEPLIAELKKHKRNVYAASAAIGLFGELAVEPLIKLLSDDEASRVYDLVFMKLWMIGNPRAIPPLIDFVDTTHDTKLQRNAVQALGFLKARQAIQSIARVLYSTEQDDLRSACVKAIAQSGGDEAYSILINAIESGNIKLQHTAILAMGDFTPIAEFDLSPLLSMLQDKNDNLRSASAVALGNLGDPRASVALIEALNDLDTTVVKYAIWALGKIGDLRARPYLEIKRQSEDEFIRREAQEALDRLRSNPS